MPLNDARASALQFRYLLVTDGEGLKAIDVTVPEKALARPRARRCRSPTRAASTWRAPTPTSRRDGRDLRSSTSRSRARRACFRLFDDGGKLNDARDVIVATTNASLFAYVADGGNGLKVLQLTSPEIQPKFYGFSPEPQAARDRLARDRLAGALARQGPGPRSRGGRDGRADRRLRPDRLAAVHAGGAAEVLRGSRWRRVDRERFRQARGFQGRAAAGRAHPQAPQAKRRKRRPDEDDPGPGACVGVAGRMGGRCAAVALRGEGDAFGRGELRLQPLPRLDQPVEGFERAAKRIRHVVARRQARAARKPGALERPQQAHRRKSGVEAARPRGEDLRRLPRAQSSGAMAGRTLQGCRRRELRGLPRAGRELDQAARGARRDPRGKREKRALPDQRPRGARAPVPVLSLRQQGQVRHPSHHGRRASAHQLRAGHLHPDAAAALRRRRGLAEAQGPLGRRARVGHRAGAGRPGTTGRRARPETRARRALPGAGRVRLPCLPPPDVGQRAGSRAWERDRARSGSTTPISSCCARS